MRTSTLVHGTCLSYDNCDSTQLSLTTLLLRGRSKAQACSVCDLHFVLLLPNRNSHEL